MPAASSMMRGHRGGLPQSHSRRATGKRRCTSWITSRTCSEAWVGCCKVSRSVSQSFSARSRSSSFATPRRINSVVMAATVLGRLSVFAAHLVSFSEFHGSRSMIARILSPFLRWLDRRIDARVADQARQSDARLHAAIREHEANKAAVAASDHTCTCEHADTSTVTAPVIVPAGLVTALECAIDSRLSVHGLIGAPPSDRVDIGGNQYVIRQSVGCPPVLVQVGSGLEVALPVQAHAGGQ